MKPQRARNRAQKSERSPESGRASDSAFRQLALAAAGLCLISTPLAAQEAEFRPAHTKPGLQVEWDRRAAAHLMRRAGFSASPEELDQVVEQGFEATLEKLLNPETVDDPKVEPYEGSTRSPRNFTFVRITGAPGEEQKVANLDAYRDWFLYRMIFSKRQLKEKMTLFWHDHFATSGAFVYQVTLNQDEIPLIGIQHELIRRNAMGNFRDFVHEIAHDPAMLVWLDNLSNIKGHPNENWARELMELFTIGIGNYTETDIQESARAFTGWSLSFETGAFRFIPNRHDFGEKTFMGLTGNLDGDDIIDRIFEQHETARFIARKLWEYFVYPDPSEEIVDELGDVFRDSGYEIRPLLRAIFEHPEFFSARAHRALVKSPAELAVHFAREAGFDQVESSFLPLLVNADHALFDPPDVSGWPSGTLWLNTSTVLTRFNFFARNVAFRETVYVGPELDRRLRKLPAWLIDFIDRQQLATFDDFIGFFLETFLQGEVSPDARLALENYMQKGANGVFQPFDLQNPDADVKIRGLVFLILTLPEYQSQ